MASDSAYPVFQHYGTAAQRGAFTPSPAAGTQPVYVWFETDTLLTWLYDTSWHNISASNGAFAFTADITPSQITSNQNNYNPTGLSTATVLRLSSDASRDITGLQGGADGRLILIVNVGGFNIVLKDASGSSSAANQFAFDADLTLTPDTGCTLLYDSTASVWRCVGVGKATGGGGGSGTVTNTGTLTSGKAIIGNGTVDVTVSSATGIAHLSSGTLTGSNVVESEITLADNTTNDVSTSAHGFFPKLPSGVPGVLLGYTQYSPATTVQFTTTSTTMSDMDATNLSVTFTVPASGKVLIRLTAYEDGSTTQQYFWGLRSGSSYVVGVGGPFRDSDGGQRSVAVVLSGLTPGASLTYKWAHAITGGATGRTWAGPGSPSTATITNSAGAMIMEVWAA